MSEADGHMMPHFAGLTSRYGKDIELKLIEPKRGLINLPRFGFSAESLIGDVAASIEDRAAWARFGL